MDMNQKINELINEIIEIIKSGSNIYVYEIVFDIVNYYRENL